jgi:hypothetical protein
MYSASSYEDRKNDPGGIVTFIGMGQTTCSEPELHDLQCIVPSPCQLQTDVNHVVMMAVVPAAKYKSQTHEDIP